MAYIYCITNQVNNKKYVGKTLFCVETRWKEHCSDSLKERCEKRPLYNAIRKYGNGSFIVNTLEECSVDEADQKEIYWIDKLGTYGKGYNATFGGDGSTLYDHKEIIAVYKQGNTVKETADKIGCCIDTVSKILKANSINGYKNNSKNLSKRIKQYSLEGEYLRTFEALARASEWLCENGYIKKIYNSIGSKISAVANNKAKTAYKFIWKWAD